MSDARRAPRGPSTALVRVGPAVLYVAAVFVMGSVPLSGPPAPAGSDKVAHLVIFGAMVPILLRAVHYVRADESVRASLTIAMVGSSAIGALLEIWQSFIPYRSMEFLDWVADTVGAVAATALMLAVLARRRA